MRGQCGVAVNSEHHVTVMTADRDTLKLSITEAEREVDIAERHLKNKKLYLQFLQNQLQDLIIADVRGVPTRQCGPATVRKPSEPEDEAARKARVRRRWRVLAMKIKFGLGAQAMAMKRRNVADASSFIDKETEVSGGYLSGDTGGTTLFRRPRKRISWIWRVNVPGRQETRDISEELASVSVSLRAETISKLCSCVVFDKESFMCSTLKNSA